MSRFLAVRLVADRVVAAVLLVLCAPVLGVLGALVARHDGGPALIAVPRVGRGEAQTRALYALLDRLSAAHPAVEIETCASGGGRVDLDAVFDVAAYTRNVGVVFDRLRALREEHVHA